MDGEARERKVLFHKLGAAGDESKYVCSTETLERPPPGRGSLSRKHTQPENATKSIYRKPEVVMDGCGNEGHRAKAITANRAKINQEAYPQSQVEPR
jgi:hypothetical protein